MRFILMAAIAALMLTGCATSSLQGEARPTRSGGMFAVATLAPWGSFEHEAAPAYTRLAVARRLTANRLDAGRITVSQARRVQDAADAARAALDAARARADRGDREGARSDLAGAVALVDAVEQIIREAPR
jgi:hypothetical protein